MHLRRWLHAKSTRALSSLLSLSLVLSQLGPLPMAEASHLGSTIASAGSAPPPAATLIESFQPDLFTGRATTSIPIVVPPGRKGLQPSLALTYASSGRNGWVGVGWSLELGSIERSIKRGVPKYDSSDTFMLQFQGISFELVKILDGTYRAKDEGLFLRVENKGASGWEARDKAGTRYLFGGSPDTEQAGASGTFRWALRKILDPNGNSMTISYVIDRGQLYPSQIQYTGHETSGSQDLPPTNRVDFVLEPTDRPDVDVSERAGVAITTAKRLKEITVTVSGQLVRKYQLGYTQSSRTGRSLLASATQVGADGVSTLPPATFTYQSSTEPTYAKISNTGLSGSNLWNVRFASVDWSNLNGAVLYPSQVSSWSSTTYTQPSGSFGGFSWSTDSQGNLSVGADRDMNIYFWTYVFVASAKTVNVTLSQSEDSQIRFFLNGSTSEVPGWPTKSLGLNAGWNLIEITSYNQNAGFGWSSSGSLASQVNIMNPTQFIQPALSGDFNGDGLTDLALFDQPSGTWKVGISCGCNFRVDAVWLTGFGSTSTAPILGDWDGDGRTDIATYNAGTWRFAKSTGTSFQADALPSLSFGSGTPLIGDFNGDGILDLATYNAGSWSVALGTGTGFTPTVSFSLGWGGSQYEPLTGDFNGDGLTDLAVVDKASGNVSVAFSNGSSFIVQPTTWITGFGAAQEHVVADFNGDGASDIAYYDRSSGQVIYAPSTGTSFGSPKTVGATFSMREANDQVQVGDYNGDGLADSGVFDPITGSSELAFSNGTVVDLLSSTANGLGGTTAFTYVPSSLLDNTGGDGVPDLPFVVPVVSTVTVADGMGNSYPTSYSYAGGRYDPATKEFRGFANVTVTDPVGTKTEAHFHQDEQKKGRLQQATVSDKGGNRYSDQVNTWGCSDPYTGVHFCHLDRQVTTTFDGNATSRQAAVSYGYDLSNGNVTTITEEGDTSVSGDERTTQVSYALNTTDWIVNRPATIAVFGADGVTKLKEQRFFYDTHAALTDPPTSGNLTKVEEWLDASSTYLGTTLGYDPYGNVVSVTDPLTRTTTLAYDTATHTFLEVLTNAAGHTQQFLHDVRFGVVTKTTDPNGVATQVVYDTFARPSKLIGPNDTDSLPTASFEYDLSTVPSKVTTRVREQSGAPSVLTSYAFTDGLGRAIQVRSPAEDATKQIISGVVGFDARGFTSSQWLPYLETASSSYVAPSPTLPKVAYAYDPVGRLKSVADPDGSTTTAAYDDWVITTTDANTHQTRSTLDAYGRLTKVDEFNGTQLATTTYGYDPLHNLTQVTDAKGNVTRLAYDSLGRKRTMDDPDMGHWAYAYDAVDNLTSQTDARSVTTAFSYDTLSRLFQKTYTIPLGSSIPNPGTVSYHYDEPNISRPFTKGQLTSLTDGAGSESFEYDNLGRVVKETKTIAGSPYVFQGSFDLLDRLTSLTYPDGEAVSYTYNAQGGIQQVASAATTYVQTIDYNAADQPTKLVLGNGVTTTYAYDANTLRLTHLTTRDATLAALQDLAYTYDPVGNITRIDDLTSTNNQLLTYDDLDRLTQASGSYGALSFGYDPIGNLLTKGSTTLTYGNPDGSQPHAVTTSSEGWTFAYDANGNMISKMASAQAPAAGQLTAKRFAFDADSRLVQVDVPSSQTVTVAFQPGWNFFSLPVIPDALGITAIFARFGTDFDQISRYNADTDRFEDYVGNPKFDDFSSLEYGRGYEVYCTNPSGVSLTLTGQVPTAAPSFNFTAGSQLIGSSALTIQPSSWLLNGLISGVDYDTLHRYDTASSSLTTATQAKPAEAYFLHALKMTAWKPPLPKDVSTRLTYDAAGDRIKKASASGSTTYVGDVYEVGASDSTKHIFAGGLRIASKRSTGQLSFYHPDHLGSTNVVTDATGTPVERLAYAPFGEVFSKSGTGDVAYQFTGQRVDGETGLAFYNARYYDPAIGRFLSADPTVQDPGDPQFLNRFAYVRNNPVRFIDPSGLDPIPPPVVTGEPVSTIIVNAVLIIGSFFLSKWLFGKKKAERPSLPPGPIQPTPFTALAPLTGVSFAQIAHGTQAVGGFAANAVLNVNAIQEAATLLRVGQGWEKALAAVGLAALVADAGFNIATLGGKSALEGGVKGALGSIKGFLVDLGEGGFARFGGAESVRLGQLGEKLAEIARPKFRIPSVTKPGTFRIPDELTKTTLREVKNVKELSLTSQLRDFLEFARSRGREFILEVRKDTRISRPLQKLIDEGEIILRRNLP